MKDQTQLQIREPFAMKHIRILLIEDNRILREGIAVTISVRKK